MEKIVSTISIDYREHWTDWDSYREIVANELDATNMMPILRVTGSTAEVIGTGDGMTKAQFVILGEGENKGSDKIGKFKEGIKIGLGRLIKGGTKVTAQSRDWICTLGVEESLGIPVLVYYFEETNDYYNGVKYTLEDIDVQKMQEYHDTRFLPNESDDIILSDTTYGKILTGAFAGKLYHKRVWVQDIEENHLFGYDLFQMKLGTDRSFAHYWSMGTELGNLLERLEDEEIIDQVLDAWQKDTFESRARNMNLNDTWRDVFYQKHGEDAVVSDDAELRGKVSYNSAKLVRLQSEALVSALESAGIVEAQNFITQRVEERREIQAKSFDDISQRKKNNVKIAFGIVQNLKMFRSTFRDMVLEDRLLFFNSNLNDSRAFGEVGGNKVWIPLDTIHDPVAMCKTIVHELIHNEYGVSDLSAEMQALQGEAFKKLLEYAYHFMSPRSLEQRV